MSAKYCKSGSVRLLEQIKLYLVICMTAPNNSGIEHHVALVAPCGAGGVSDINYQFDNASFWLFKPQLVYADPCLV